MLRRYRIKDINFILIITLAVIGFIGVLLVGSADKTLQTRQALGLVAGIVIMLFVAFIDYSWVLNFYWIIYVVNLALLGWVAIMGRVTNGASRWMSIGGENGIVFQPTELSKILHHK